jgi:hypothetical protein
MEMDPGLKKTLDYFMEQLEATKKRQGFRTNMLKPC